MKKQSPVISYTLYSIVWSNIRRYQYLNGISDDQLAQMLDLSTRTLYAYDKDPSALTLERLQTFVDSTGIEAAELLKV